MNHGGTGGGGGVILGTTSEAMLVTPVECWRHRARTGKGGVFFPPFLFTIEEGLGGIKTGRYLGELLDNLFLINSLNFDLGTLLGELLEMLLVCFASSLTG
jgi:hypothetical protein